MCDVETHEKISGFAVRAYAYSRSSVAAELDSRIRHIGRGVTHISIVTNAVVDCSSTVELQVVYCLYRFGKGTIVIVKDTGRYACHAKVKVTHNVGQIPAEYDRTACKLIFEQRKTRKKSPKSPNEKKACITTQRRKNTESPPPNHSEKYNRQIK
ncbi:hypothetical protein BCR43DRAFT_234175 [Syncephalastrum racemosum]|uniref:Uncharacterized protein n=1 Tax=Syncephalastrum racemosum TaxID=13706 RepID=A0A1X2HEA5_SYNRA|nr:hypothetical protein BCR43DRAFT_234175 [Syncephalastrum racemosum]